MLEYQDHSKSKETFHVAAEDGFLSTEHARFFTKRRKL